MKVHSSVNRFFPANRETALEYTRKKSCKLVWAFKNVSIFEPSYIPFTSPALYQVRPFVRQYDISDRATRSAIADNINRRKSTVLERRFSVETEVWYATFPP